MLSRCLANLPTCGSSDDLYNLFQGALRPSIDLNISAELMAIPTTSSIAGFGLLGRRCSGLTGSVESAQSQ